MTDRILLPAAITASGRYRLPANVSAQRGAALIMGLVILFVLTLLGVAAMRTTSLEEKMAGNVQEATRAFQAAESGINSMINTPGMLSLSNTMNNNFNYTKSSAAVESTFIEFTPPKRNSGYSATQFNAANFALRSDATTNADAKSIINQGLGQIVPK